MIEDSELTCNDIATCNDIGRTMHRCDAACWMRRGATRRSRRPGNVTHRRFALACEAREACSQQQQQQRRRRRRQQQRRQQRRWQQQQQEEEEWDRERFGSGDGPHDCIMSSITGVIDIDSPGIAWHRMASHGIASHRTAPHRIASHRIAPHRIAPHRTAPHRVASHRTAPHRTASRRVASHRIASHSIASHSAVGRSHDAASCSAVLGPRVMRMASSRAPS
jgi:hypothetical protein